MAASTSDAKTYKFLGGGDGQNVGLGMVFNLLKEKISGLGVEGIKSAVKDLESDVNTLQENVGLRDGAINEHGKILDSLTKPTYTTYAKLKELVVGKKLNMLSTYIITDYLPVLSSTYSQIAQSTDKSQFALMLIANTNSTFFHECLAVDLAKDDQSNLSIANVRNLKILYDFNNDESKYDWIADGIGNGVIYRMVDEYGNDCPYDFYNIKFNFDGKYYYTFSEISGNGVNFYKDAFTNCHIEPVYINHTMTLPRNYMSIVDQAFTYDVHDIHIKGTGNKIEVTFEESSNNPYACNNIQIYSNNVYLKDRCENIYIGNNCQFDGVPISGSNIKIGNNCQINGGYITGSNIQIGNRIDQNSFIAGLEIDGTNINIGSDCTIDPGVQITGSDITIGNNCSIKSSDFTRSAYFVQINGSNIKIGDNCQINSIGSTDFESSNITIGNNCQINAIVGKSIRLGDGVKFRLVGKGSTPGTEYTDMLFPLYNVSFEGNNQHETPVMKLYNPTMGENLLCPVNYVFYSAYIYDDTGAERNDLDAYEFKQAHVGGANKGRIKMVYPDGVSWITEVKGQS